MMQEKSKPLRPDLTDEGCMRLALRQAWEAGERGEVPGEFHYCGIFYKGTPRNCKCILRKQSWNLIR